ncbi:DUF6136 family protein [Pseudoalteromonas 'SMAR']|uniref:DUF6136 family protein n=1 Tax=Pseudoalteromonas 'SMAR' TaxID=3416908 RepID=UPI003AF27C81
MWRYYLYRKDSLFLSLRQLLLQLSQFGLMIGLLFQAYVVGLVAALFLALGRLVASDNPSTQVNVAIMLLLAQSLLFLQLRHGILDSAHRRYHITILANSWHQKVADVAALLATHVLLHMSLVLGVAIGYEHFIQAWPLWVFAASQLIVALACVYRPLATFIALFASLLLSIVVHDLGYFLLLVNILVLLANRFLPPEITLSVSVSGLCSFWLSYAANHYFVMLWRAVLSLLVIWFGVIINAERADLIAHYIPGLMSLNLLCWASLGLDLRPQVTQRSAFWQSINRLKQARLSLWLILLTTAVLFTTPVYLLTPPSLSHLLPFLFLPVMILAALKSPRQLAVAWLSTLVVCYTVLLNL